MVTFVKGLNVGGATHEKRPSDGRGEKKKKELSGGGGGGGARSLSCCALSHFCRT